MGEAGADDRRSPDKDHRAEDRRDDGGAANERMRGRGHEIRLAGAPRDAWFKSGAGGFGIVVIPSLDMVIYKMAGNDAQYDPEFTQLPMLYKYDGSRDGWKPSVHTQFDDGPIGVDDGLRRLIEMAVAAAIQ